MILRYPVAYKIHPAEEVLRVYISFFRTFPIPQSCFGNICGHTIKRTAIFTNGRNHHWSPRITIFCCLKPPLKGFWSIFRDSVPIIIRPSKLKFCCNIPFFCPSFQFCNRTAICDAGGRIGLLSSSYAQHQK